MSLSRAVSAIPFEVTFPSFSNLKENAQNILANTNSALKRTIGAAVLLAHFAPAQAKSCVTQDGISYKLECDPIQTLCGLPRNIIAEANATAQDIFWSACQDSYNSSQSFGSDAFYKMSLCTVSSTNATVDSSSLAAAAKANTPNKEIVSLPDLGTLVAGGVVAAVVGSVLTCGIFACRNSKKDKRASDPLLGSTLSSSDDERNQKPGDVPSSTELMTEPVTEPEPVVYQSLSPGRN